MLGAAWELYVRSAVCIFVCVGCVLALVGSVSVSVSVYVFVGYVGVNRMAG